MEQYLNLVWKNYTASLSQKSDDDDFMGDHDDGKRSSSPPTSLANPALSASDTFAGNDLHYKIPFWIGVIVISLLCLSAIIASIRYCFYTLCSSHTGKLDAFLLLRTCITAKNERERKRF